MYTNATTLWTLSLQHVAPHTLSVDVVACMLERRGQLGQGSIAVGLQRCWVKGHRPKGLSTNATHANAVVRCCSSFVMLSYMLTALDSCNAGFTQCWIHATMHSHSVGFHATACVQSLHAKYLGMFEEFENLAHWFHSVVEW